MASGTAHSRPCYELFWFFFVLRGLGWASASFGRLVAHLGAVLAYCVGSAFFIATFPAACNVSVFHIDLNDYNVHKALCMPNKSLNSAIN